MKKNIIWIAVIDSHKARFFQTLKKEPLSLIKEIILETEPNPKPGRTFDSFGKGRHAIEPHSNFKDVERQHLSAQITEFLQESLNQNKFDDLILIATHKIGSTLEEKLSDQIKQKIIHIIHKNILDLSPSEIREYLLKMDIKELQ